VNKKGSVMVEATLIFPIVVCVVVILLYMAVVLFQSICIETSMSRAMRACAGELTGTVFYRNFYINDKLYTDVNETDAKDAVTSEFLSMLSGVPVEISVDDIGVELNRGAIYSDLKIDVEKRFSAKYLFALYADKRYSGAMTLHDEAQWIRACDMLAGDRK